MKRIRNSEFGIRNSEFSAEEREASYEIWNLTLIRSFFNSKLHFFLLSLLAVTQIPLPAYPTSDSCTGVQQCAPTTSDSHCSTQDLKTLTDRLLRDLPGYANRTSQRARRLSRSTDLYTYVLVAGNPEFEPLTTDPGVYQPKSPQADGEDVQQVFFTTLERQYLKDRAVELQGFHWAFFAKTEDGWRLASMFTRIGDRAGKRPPTPPEETSDGIIAQAIETWLRDCRARSRARDAKE
ncbi:hypothetical protein C7Y66_29415 [Chroococcidiopsis sp. CCALA 051]|uniref:hypothetical protein n=1 Tax=Chroococcidiopsis sp. CCALA 051 TaxID=869949 RepID=UPI000D0DD925|nr:hypothetical protein [Chroococcidiopsis sp. CCALA 051]PSM45616.1 hypothetical protein C7Y66_29415 [Chroococcidiopsis sp. CCALA 051]